MHRLQRSNPILLASVSEGGACHQRDTHLTDVKSNRFPVGRYSSRGRIDFPFDSPTFDEKFALFHSRWDETNYAIVIVPTAVLCRDIPSNRFLFV